MNLGRIGGLLSRHMYLYKRSFARMLEIFYWPFLDLVVWGFITMYLKEAGVSLHGAVAFFLGALILWDVLFRSQQGVAVSFLEEMWSRNLMNLFASPLTVGEYLASTMIMSILKVTAVASLMMVFAWVFYSYDMLKIGLSLLPFSIYSESGAIRLDYWRSHDLDHYAIRATSRSLGLGHGLFVSADLLCVLPP